MTMKRLTAILVSAGAGITLSCGGTCGDKVAVVGAPGQSSAELYVWDYGPESNSTPNGTIHAGGVYIEPTSAGAGQGRIDCLDPSGAATWN